MENNKIALNAVYTLVLLAIAAGFIYTLAKNRRPKEDAEIPISKIEESFRRFASAKKLAGELPIGTIEVEENFKKTYTHSGKEKTGAENSTVVLDASSIVTHRYSVPTSEDWSFLQVNNTLRVVVPEIKPLPPTYDKSSLKINWSGKSRLDIARNDEFKADFEAYLSEKSSSPLYIDAVAEKARAAVIMFLAEMSNSNNFPFDYIHVKFRNQEKFPRFPYAIRTEKKSLETKSQ